MIIATVTAWITKGTVTRFLLSTPGLCLMGFLAFTVWTQYQRYDAAKEARVVCEAKYEKASIAEKFRQAREAEKAAQLGEELDVKTTKELNDLRKRAEKLRADLRSTKASKNNAKQSTCKDALRIPSDLRKRLLDIR